MLAGLIRLATPTRPIADVNGAETVARRLGAALLVGAAGPLVVLLAVHLAGGPDENVSASDPVGIGFELLRIGFVLFAVAAPLGALATLVAFVLSRAAAPILGWLGSMVAMPLWFSIVERLPVSSLAVFLGLLGLLPFAVRLAMPTRPGPGRSGRSSWICQHQRTLRRDGDGVLHVGAARAVARS